MAANLIAQLQNEFSDDVISKLAYYLGETPAKTQTALGYAIPAVVGGFFQKTQTPQGATDLLGLLQRGGFDGKSFGNIASLLRSAPAELIKSSGNLLSSLFGPRQINLTDSIAATSGLGKQASSSLLALATCTSPAWWVKKRALRAASMRLRSPTCSAPKDPIWQGWHRVAWHTCSACRPGNGSTSPHACTSGYRARQRARTSEKRRAGWAGSSGSCPCCCFHCSSGCFDRPGRPSLSARPATGDVGTRSGTPSRSCCTSPCQAHADLRSGARRCSDRRRGQTHRLHRRQRAPGR